MAKLHEDSDDGLPELSAVIGTYAKVNPPKPSTRSTVTPMRDRVQVPRSSQRKPSTSLDVRLAANVTAKIRGAESQRTRRQRSLKVAPVNTVLLSRWDGASGAAQALAGATPTSELSTKGTPERSVKDAVRSGTQALGPRIQPQCPLDKCPIEITSRCADKEVPNGDASHPTWLPNRQGDGQAACSEMPVWSTSTRLQTTSVASGTSVTDAGDSRLDCVQAGKSSRHGDTTEPLATARLLLGTEFSFEPSALLRFSPPRSRRRSPAKNTEQECFTTPPATPTKSKLQSPKKQHRIPPSPHRPSIDAFWSQDVINDWNDEYSSRKVPKPGRARTIHSVIDEEDEELSPSVSPRRSPVKLPAKRNRAALEARKDFNNNKHRLASEFLKELDDVVSGGRIASLAALTGGVHLIWSKKLNSTAGRANWKQEVVRSSGSGEPPSSKYRHHASIELAEKVIDDENRLINVIAHEYCHLANFMISGIKDNPHGKEFKQWAQKCSEAFRHREIEVTTKHSYIIDYKYVWECTSCGMAYKRHSKSIDPARHTCGACKSKLLQTKPVPRTTAPSDYQIYFKAHFRQTKDAHPESSHKEVMGLIAKAYKEQKVKASSTDAVATMTESADVREQEEAVHEGARGEAEIDAVSRTLDFLSLTGG